MPQSTRRLISLFAAGAAFVTVGLVAAGWSLYKYQARGPILVVDELDRELPPSGGTSTTPRVSFHVRNGGNELLEIKKISTTCGCVVVTAPKKSLAPGEASEIEVTAIRPPVGTAKVTITVRSNSRLNPVTELTVTGFGESNVPYIQYSSDSINFREVREAGASQGLWIVAVEEKHAEPWIHDLTCDLPFLLFRRIGNDSKPFDQGFVERTYRFRVDVAELPAPGVYKGSVRLANGPDIKLPINCQVPDRYSVSPQVLYLNFLPEEASQTVSVFLQLAPGTCSDRVKTTTSAPEIVRVERSDDGAPASASYRVTVSPGPVANIRYEVAFRIPTEAGESVLRVPIFGTRTGVDHWKQQ